MLFIVRYCKEATGGLDDAQSRLLAEHLHKLEERRTSLGAQKIFAHLETELMDNLQEHAETEAIRVFAQRRQSGTTPNIDNVGHDLCIGAGDHGSSSASRTLGRLLVTSGDGGGATPDSMDRPGRVLDIVLDHGNRGWCRLSSKSLSGRRYASATAITGWSSGCSSTELA